MVYRKLATPPPLERMTGVYWYHGTPWDAAASGIINEGIRWGQISNYSGMMESVEGMVYLTTKIDLACSYAMGSRGGDEHCYVFVFDGADLEDVYLNEDTLAALLQSLDGIDWRELSFEAPKWLKSYLDKEGKYPNYQVIAKRLLLQLEPEKMTELLELFDNRQIIARDTIAHRGTLMPIEGYRYNRADWQRVPNYTYEEFVGSEYVTQIYP